MLLLSSAYFFKINFQYFGVSNSLDPDQDRHSVCPDLGPSCLQRLSADDKLPQARKELTDTIYFSVKKLCKKQFFKTSDPFTL